MATAYSDVLYTFATSYSAPFVALYLVMVLLSSRLMKLFTAVELRTLLTAHSRLCCLINLYALCFLAAGFWQVMDFFSKDKGCTNCIHVRLSSRHSGLIQHGMMVYWLAKLYELLDTLFVVLRHRKNQISFLHVFYHSSIALIADGGHLVSTASAFVPMNCLVHVAMYGYYGWTAYYTSSWKKRIIQMQIVQFFVGLVHGTIGYLYHGFCIHALLYSLGMLAQFLHLYYGAYISPAT